VETRTLPKPEPLAVINDSNQYKLLDMFNRIFIIFIVSTFSFLTSSLCKAEDHKDSLEVLFVGNSYTYMENLPQIVSIISESTKIKLVTTKSVAGGARLKDHWNGNRGLRTKQLIEKGKYDIVILQGQSMAAINEPDSLRKYSDLFCQFVVDNGAKPFLFTTWARKKVPQYQDIINHVYTKISTENNATMLPIGDAWKLAKQLRPDIEIFSFDGSHPNKLGTFLTACIIVGTITDEIPQKITSIYKTFDKFDESILLMYVDPLDVTFCKKVTEEILK